MSASHGGSVLGEIGWSAGLTKAKAALLGTVAVLSIAALITGGIVFLSKRAEKPDPAPVATRSDKADRTDGDKSNAGASDTDATSRRTVKAGGTRLFGTVTVQETGKPAAGATVLLIPSMKTVTAGVDGTYEISGIRTPQVAVAAFSGPYVSHLRQQEVKPTPIAAGERNGPCNLPLRRGLTLAGTITDSESGEPVPDASVKITLFLEREVRTDAKGGYRLEGLPEMQIRMDVEADDYALTRTLAQPMEGGENFCDLALDRGGLVNVQVTDTEGKPLAGTKVSFFVGESFAGWDKGATTDSRGRLRLRGISCRNPQKLIASLQGYQSVGDVKPRFASGQRTTNATIVMRSTETAPRPPQFVFTGRVTDAAGAPVSDARVAWASARKPNSGNTTTKTDADGRYRLAFPGETGIKQLNVSAKGYAPAWRQGVAPGTTAAPATIDFTLEGAHWIEGTVVGPDKEPIADAMVVPYRDSNNVAEPRYEIPGQPGPMAPFRTDAEGRFRIEDLPTGPIVLWLRSYGSSDINEFPCAVDRAVTVVMQQAGVIRGRVVDEKTGDPVPDFAVKVSGGGVSVTRSNPGQKVWSSEGRFVLRDLNQGRPYRVTIEARGYPAFEMEQIRAQSPNADAETAFVLVAGQALTGTIVDAGTGRPVTTATVTSAVDRHSRLDWELLESQSASYYRQVKQTHTDDKGAFSLEESAEPGTLFILAEGYGRLVIRPDKRRRFMDSETGDLKIALDPGALVTGVVYRGRKVLPDARVHVTFQGTPEYSLESCRTDSSGVFSVARLAAGPYRLSVCRREGNTVFGSLYRNVVVRTGEELRIAIGNDLGPHALYGSILDATGKTVAGAAVELTPTFACPYRCFVDHSDAQGRYRIDELLPGTYSVTVRKDLHEKSGLKTMRVRGTVEINGDLEHSFLFQERRRVTGHVTTSDRTTGMQFARAFLTSTMPHGASSRDETTPTSSGSARILEGRFTFEGWYRGEYHVDITATIGENQTVRARFAERRTLDNSTANQELGALAMPQPGPYSLSGTVLGPKKRPVPGAHISLKPHFNAAYTWFSSTTGSDGRFRINGLEEGTYTAAVSTRRGQTGSTSELRSTVAIRGDTEKTFRLFDEFAVIARLTLETDAAALARHFTRAVLKRSGWNEQDGRAADGTYNIAETEIDARGNMSFAGRFRGDYTLSLRFKEGERFILMPLPQPIHLDNLAADQELGDVALSAADFGALPLEILVDASAAPRPSYVTAILFRDGDHQAATLAGISQEEENQVIRPLLAGRYEVAIAAPGYTSDPPSHQVTISAGGTTAPIRFALTPRGIASGSAYPEIGPWRRIALKEVTIAGSSETRVLRAGANQSAGGPYDEILAQQDRFSGGSFTFVDLPPGDYEVTVRADGFETTTAPVTVEVGHRRDLMLRMRLAGE